MTNDLAEMHYLTKEESKFFATRVNEINNKLDKITKEQKLKGQWTLSANYKWLIKIKD